MISRQSLNLKLVNISLVSHFVSAKHSHRIQVDLLGNETQKGWFLFVQGTLIEGKG